ncbi:MAG: FkbM family methyltransferase [Bryobacteraceae bacterium]
MSWIDEEKVRALDIPQGRAELAALATGIAREHSPGSDLEILWDGMWMRRVHGVWFPDPDVFRVKQPNWQRWADMDGKYLRDANDYWFHVYQPAAGHVIVDIGAGRGEDVFGFSRAVGPEGRVWALEPHPVSFAVLERFCELNRLENVTTLNLASTSEPADLQIETLPVWESNYIRPGAASEQSHAVRGVPFDTVAQENGIDRIDFLKMNIEGAERDALPGCREALKRAHYVCIAAHDFRAARGEGESFRTLDFVREFLTAAGFQLVTRDTDPRYYVPYHVHGVRA